VLISLSQRLATRDVVLMIMPAIRSALDQPSSQTASGIPGSLRLEERERIENSLKTAEQQAETIYTIGHSTHSIEEFIDILKAYHIETLGDIRTIPRSLHNPQFSQGALAQALESSDIAYRHMKDLGGLRHAKKDSPNEGWRNPSFRGYADYMQTSDFQQAMKELVALGKLSRTVIMCAEAVPWRCHRSLVGDALLVRNVAVEHILSAHKSSWHKLTKFARIEGSHIFYPAETEGENNDIISAT
jgi:hypothetical protein